MSKPTLYMMEWSWNVIVYDVHDVNSSIESYLCAFHDDEEANTYHRRQEVQWNMDIHFTGPAYMKRNFSEHHMIDWWDRTEFTDEEMEELQELCRDTKGRYYRTLGFHVVNTVDHDDEVWDVVLRDPGGDNP